MKVPNNCHEVEPGSLFYFFLTEELLLSYSWASFSLNFDISERHWSSSGLTSSRHSSSLNVTVVERFDLQLQSKAVENHISAVRDLLQSGVWS